MANYKLPEPGSSMRLAYDSVRRLPLTIYRPTVLKDNRRVIVAVHGISRNYDAQFDAYSDLAEAFGCWLLVPEFEKRCYPRYQQLAKGDNYPRADIDLNVALIAFRKHVGLPDFKIRMCGYSGGAQFAHRYALVHPAKIDSLIICSAGWYTFPDSRIEYPYGVKNPPAWLGKQRVNELLNLPVLVAVGDQDIDRDKSLRQEDELDTQQGSTRFERAQRWVAGIQVLSQAKGVPEKIEFHVLKGHGHCFLDSFKTRDLNKLIKNFWNECG